MNKKDILCAVDFSESSLEALKWSVALARNMETQVVIMFCYRLIAPIDDEEALDLKRKMEEEANKKFREFENAHLNGQHVSYKFITEVGFYHFRIEMFLRDHPVELLVMGNSLVENFDEYKNVGFDKFLKNARVPVVIVPQEHHEPVQAPGNSLKLQSR